MNASKLADTDFYSARTRFKPGRGLRDASPVF